MSATCQGCGVSIPPSRGGMPRKWCSERCRKSQYAGVCEDCGAPTDGTTPGRGVPERCQPCNRRKQHEERYWTPEAVIGALQGWAEDHDGVPPIARDWLQGTPLGYPPVRTIQNVFGSWNAGIEAAGFTPYAPGHYGRDGEDPELCLEIRRRYEAGESAPALAREYGCAAETIRYRIRKAGGRIRSMPEAVRLRDARVAA